MTDDQPPAFVDRESCKEWLRGLPLANPATAQTTLAAQLDLANAYALAGKDRVEILEAMREPLRFAQAEAARRFAGRALPMGVQEREAFETNQAVWMTLVTGYLRCLSGSLIGEPDLTEHAALAAQRVLATLADWQLDRYLASHETGPRFWHMAHGAYAAAEQLGVAEDEVADKAAAGRKRSARASYARILLLHAASPYELSPRRAQLAARWLERWAPKVTIGMQAPTDTRMPPLAVDLGGELPAGAAAASENLRWLNTDGLAKSLRKRIALLKEGADPATLKLGEDCPPDAHTLLRHLYERCCKGAVHRGEARRSASGPLLLSVGPEAAYARLTGAAFDAAPAQLNRAQIEELATLGYVSTRNRDSVARPQAPAAWALIDESPTGARLEREPQAGDARVGIGTLVALAAAGEDSARLGAVRWVMQLESGRLHMGLRLMGGVPQGASLRPAALGGAAEKFRPAFLLPALPALGTSATLVIPAAWHRPGRHVELFLDGSVHEVRLGTLLERESSYDRCEYDVVESRQVKDAAQ